MKKKDNFALMMVTKGIVKALLNSLGLMLWGPKKSGQNFNLDGQTTQFLHLLISHSNVSTSHLHNSIHLNAVL